MRIERLLADPQFIGQIVHGDAAKTVVEEMSARGINDSLAGGA
jgi:hypothetical protein